MTKFAGLLLGLVLPLIASAHYVSPSLPIPAKEQADEVNILVVQNQVDSAWRLACTVKKVDCSKIDSPLVIFDLTEYGLWGRYEIGSAEVHISVLVMEDPFSMVIMAHEMVHYLQWVEGSLDWPRTRSENCLAEKEAFDLDHAVAVILGLDKDFRVDLWWEVAGLYGCDTDGKPLPRPNGPRGPKGQP